MGRPPNGGGPAFRFNHSEVAEMEAHLQEINNAVPPREVIHALAEKFSASAERAGKVVVQTKQVWNWFQNRRYAQRSKIGKTTPVKLAVSSLPRDESLQFRNVAAPISVPAVGPEPFHAGRNSVEAPQLDFEAKSARDGAWYDVAAFLSHRFFETGDPDVRVRFSGFGMEEDEWINVRRCVRQRSLPCESVECISVLPGDLILCFQEGKEQALYFDAHILDAQRRRHDVRGCRCRFLVRYDHDQSEEIVPLRKVCRRPETDYRLQILHALKASGSMELSLIANDPITSASKDMTVQRNKKQRKLMDVNTDEVTTVSVSHPKDPISTQSDSPALTNQSDAGAASDVLTDDAAANNDSACEEKGGNTPVS